MSDSRSGPLKLAYLLSQYPAVNHVFMLREVRLLRRRGFDIQVFSISNADRPVAAMTEAEREEVKLVFYVKRAGLARLISAHCGTFFSRPSAYCRGLWCAIGIGGLSPRKTLHSIFYFAEAVIVGHAMKRMQISHLHTHFASTVALLVSRIFPVTMSATFHGPMEFDAPEEFRLEEKVCASSFSCAISQYGLGQLMRFCRWSQWPKLELTRLGVDPAEFAPRPFRPNPSPFQILSVGRLAPVKAQHILISVMATLVREGHDVTLRFAGDGPDRAELQQHAEAMGLSRHVIFAGNVNQDDLRNLYRECDIFALPSFSEGLPVVLMEAMAMEIPCIATWVNGVPELIRDGVNGLAIPPADEGALYRAIRTLIADSELRLRIGREGRRSVLADFDAIRNTDTLAGIFSRRLI